jgi:hypothetical protein
VISWVLSMNGRKRVVNKGADVPANGTAAVAAASPDRRGRTPGCQLPRPCFEFLAKQ